LFASLDKDESLYLHPLDPTNRNALWFNHQYMSTSVEHDDSGFSKAYQLGWVKNQPTLFACKHFWALTSLAFVIVALGCLGWRGALGSLPLFFSFHLVAFLLHRTIDNDCYDETRQNGLPNTHAGFHDRMKLVMVMVRVASWRYVCNIHIDSCLMHSSIMISGVAFLLESVAYICVVSEYFLVCNDLS